MSDLLSSFEICGFRAFEYLSLERLGRVNLIVGKNNVGKTSLLEALWVYANRGAPPVLWSLLEGREESRPLIGRSPDEEDIENLLLSLRYLFYGRNELTGAAQAIRLGPLNSADQSLSIKFTWVENFLDEKGTRRQVEVSQPGDAPERSPGIENRYRASGIYHWSGAAFLAGNLCFSASTQVRLPAGQWLFTSRN